MSMARAGDGGRGDEFWEWLLRGDRVFGWGRIEGSLNLMGDIAFSGRRRPGPGTSPVPAARMRYEWEGYNEDAYEEERRARW